MRRLLVRPIVVLAIGALAGVAVSATPVAERTLRVDTADHFIHPDVDVWFRDGPFRGILNARQVGDSRTVRVNVSLHRLEPGTTYRVLVSRLPCSRTHVRSARVLEIDLTTGPGSDDAQRLQRVRRTGSLRSLRSVRVFEHAGDVLEQRSCLTGSYDTGTGTLTRAGRLG
jgi:hypothetical protein